METTQEIKENKMGVMPINKLLITMSLPLMASMLVQALYNVVDSIFVSRLGESALTAVSLAFPIQNLIIAIGGGTGVGINALLSRSLGERNFKEANNAANNGIFLALINSFVFLLIGIFGIPYFFYAQTDDPEIVQYGITYLTICCTLSLGVFCQITFERLLQSTGKTMYNMVSQATGAIINIILDPIFIFGYFGFPAMGVAGAAIATVAGQTIAGCLGLYLNLKKNNEIQLSARGFRPKLSTIKRIYAVGVPSIIMVSIGSVMVFCLNKILLAFTSTAAAVFGVYFKLQSFIFMPVFGLNNGLVPIISYNYGARKKDRIIKSIKLGVIYAVSVMFIGFAVFNIIPGTLLSFFEASEDMLEIGIPALRIISVSFLFAGYCIICSTVFQALGRGVMSMITALVRQIIVLVPVAYVISLFGEVTLVWWSFPVAEITALIISTVFLRSIYKKIIKPLGSLDTGAKEAYQAVNQPD